MERRIAEMQNGSPLNFPTEVEFCKHVLRSVPSAQRLSNLIDEARGILREVAGYSEEYRVAAGAPVDPRGLIVGFDPERTTSMPTLASVADGLLFKEDHFQPGHLRMSAARLS
jgi:hypothetical protein